MVHELGQVQWALATKLFDRGGIHMAQGQVQSILAGKAEGIEVCLFWKDITKFYMLVFQAAFLSGPHGITEKKPGPGGAVRGGFHCVSGGEFRTAVGDKDMDIFPEDIRAEDGLEQVNAIKHILCGFGRMEDGEKDASIQELKCLEKGAGRFIVINSIHLCHEDIGVVKNVLLIIFVSTAKEIFAVLPFFVSHSLLFRKLPGNLPAQIHDRDTGNLVEDVIFDIIINGLFGDIQFRVDLKDLERGKPLFQERPDDVGHLFGLSRGKVDALAGVNKGQPVIHLGIIGVIGELVESAAAPGGAAVAGARRAVPSGAVEGAEIRAVRGTITAEGTFSVGFTFEWEAALVGMGAMVFDFLPNSGFIFPDGFSDSSFGRAIFDTGENDMSFFESKMRKRVIRGHRSHPPFWQLSGRESVRLNAT